MSAIGGNTLLVFANVDGESDPDGEEHAPVDEFEGEGQVRVGERAVDHAGGHDPDQGEEGPDTLQVSLCCGGGEGGGGTAATVKRTSFHPVILSRVYEAREKTKMAKTS